MGEKLPSDMRSLSEQVYNLIRRDILQGLLLPDMKLRIETVSERYKIGAVPVREALNRLSAEGLVERKSQRGFFVAPLEMGDLEELVKTRIWLETRALQESIARSDEAWEEALVVSFHRLSRTSRRLMPDDGREISEEWDIRHKEFHMQLIDHCGSSWLLSFCATMMDQAARYRNVSMNTHSSQARREGALAEHQAILDAVLSRDAELACRLLSEHYQATLAALRPAGCTDAAPGAED
ncbi:GntR family transcriptional regulator [Paracoccus sp. MBLB3053]|uniref:GntR family transcriptional regulator n=1 Tax=Paracoccus aurantius TaxID=3073814 RepID=A0ABU2HWZ1_9RHOB|nr:GntR family transcriptional regulator [Paracoccus sp. MBLB3053]MDS9469572.1 GntR family transcriptional regulator [Paracoccus sp. MBLB3053]